MPLYRMCFEVKSLGDAAAFEDLAKQMGVPMELTTVQQLPEPEKTSRAIGRKHHAVTPHVVASVKSTIMSYPNASNIRVGELASLPHGQASIARIRNGEYDKGGPRYAKMMAAHAGQ